MMSRIVVVFGTIALSVSAASAGNNTGYKKGYSHHSSSYYSQYRHSRSYHHGSRQSKSHHRGKSANHGADITYDIAQDTCAVTINSNKRLQKMVLKDSDGNVVKKWRHIRGNSFTNFGVYTSYLADGELHIASGKRSSTTEIGDDFRFALEACLMPECPFADEIDPSIQKVGRNTADSCTVFKNTTGLPTPGSQFMGIIDGRAATPAQELYFGIVKFTEELPFGCTSVGLPSNTVATPCSPDGVIEDGRLEPDEARACADLLQGCTNLVIPD